MEAKTELQKNAIADARRLELETFQRALDIQWLNNRMEDGRMGRCLALIQKEAEMEKNFQERTDHAAIVNARAEKETALGIEVAKVRREEACELLRRHYLRERDPSLKELSKKLQAGYVCRDLRQQIKNNEYRKLQEKAEEQHTNDILRNALYNDHEAKEHEETEKKKRNTQYCLELQQQLVNRQQQRQCQYEDTLIEKKMLDEIMKTISDEDQRELQQKREQTEKLRREMVTSQQAREAWRRKQQQVVVMEERAQEQQRRACADRAAAVTAERQRKMQMKEELNDRIIAKIVADEGERLERESIIKQLQEQEYLEKNVQDEVRERRLAERAKEHTKRALMAQVDGKKERAAQQRLADADFRKQTEAKIAAEDEKELAKQLKVKEKSRLFYLDLQQQIQDNAARRERERRRDEARAQNVWDYDRAWREEVSEERKKIVEEHVPHLLGYLQAGVVKKEDLPAVRAGADKHEELAPLDIESLAVSNRPKRFSKCNAQCRILREF